MKHPCLSKLLLIALFASTGCYNTGVGISVDEPQGTTILVGGQPQNHSPPGAHQFPTITSVRRSQGLRGERVVIEGTGLEDTQEVHFADTEIERFSATANQLSFRPPSPKMAGQIVIITPTGSATIDLPYDKE